MNNLNALVVVEVLLKDRIEKIESGLIQWNVSNQFDESVLESALSVVSEEVLSELFERIPQYQNQINENNIMSIAHSISNFNAPEISDAWVN